MRSSANCSLVSRKRPDVRLKTEAMWHRKVAQSDGRWFEPRRLGEEEYEDGMVFQIQFGRKALLVMGAVLVDLLLTLLRLWLHPF